MTPGIGLKKFLDPETCWKDWIVRFGSLGKVRAELLRRGVVNEKTGNPPTRSAIEKAAFMWAADHHEEARKDLDYAWRNAGQILTDEKWREFIVGAAKLAYHQRPIRFEEFCKKYGFENHNRVS